MNVSLRLDTETRPSFKTPSKALNIEKHLPEDNVDTVWTRTVINQPHLAIQTLYYSHLPLT